MCRRRSVVSIVVIAASFDVLNVSLAHASPAPVRALSASAALGLLALDLPIHVRAKVRELRQLLRRDLVARAWEIDLHDLLHLGGRVREDDDPVGEVDGLVDVVSDEEDRDPVLLTDAKRQVLEIAARLRVDRRERLVHEQDRGLVGERARDRDPLLHPAGELPRVAIPEARPGRPPPATRCDEALAAPSAPSFLCRSGRSTLFATEVQGISERLYSWKTSAISSGGLVTGLPRRSTRPFVGRSSPATHLSSVVLPQPEGPTTQRNSPSSTMSETSAIACAALAPVPYVLPTFVDLE